MAGKKRGPGPKRTHEVTDLTGDEDSSRPTKLTRQDPPSSSFQPAATLSAGDRATWQPHPPAFGDEPGPGDLTQSDDGPDRELYVSLESSIVGVQHYKGHASEGELVVCKREPSNPYDTNAIRVDNVFGQQIGHIPRRVAEKLAPYLVGPGLKAAAPSRPPLHVLLFDTFC